MSTNPKTLRLYTSYWHKHFTLFAGALLFAPAYVLQNIISPLFIAKALGQLVSHHPVSPRYIWFAGASLICGPVLAYIANHRFEMRLTLATMRDLYNRCLHHILQQEYGFFSNNFGGSLVSQASKLVGGYEKFSDTVFYDLLGLVTGVLVAIGIMTYYNPLIGVLVGVLWLASAGLVAYLAIRRMPIRRWAVAKDTQLTGELADIITNAVTVKTFAREAVEEQRYGKTNNDRADRYRKSWSAGIRNNFVILLLCSLLQFVVVIGGVHGVQNGTLSIATFLLFQVYILRIIDSISKISQSVRALEGLLGDATEMTELLERQPLVLDPVHPEPCRISDGAIQFNDVHFTYGAQGGSKMALLDRFNLTIKPGEKVGLVGPSGGGKSTLTRLLLRFIDVQDGAILIDGQDIKHIKQDDLHTAISYVPQEPLLFHRSIKENIRYGNPGVSDAQIVHAAKQAHAHEFITQLSEGYDTLVGERGVKLSGGQRQRVAIARSMIKSAPILVLDEATSALDSESEKLIQAALWELMKGRTAIVIAHRLSTIQKMDRILVLEDGKIVEQGTHHDLLAHKALYARLWAHQSGGFIED